MFHRALSSARDEHQLQLWFERAFTASSAEEIFEELDGLDLDLDHLDP